MKQNIFKKLNHIAASGKSKLKNFIPFGVEKRKITLEVAEIENLLIRINQSNTLNIAHKIHESSPFTQIIFGNEKWDLRKTDTQLLINQYSNNKHIHSYTLQAEDAKKILVYILDSSLKKILDFGINELRKSKEIKYTNSYDNENRSLEWLRVSLEVYKKALEEIQKDKDLILEFYFGLDETKKLLIFNSYNIFLQIHFHNSLMSVQFYNDKDSKSKTPAMSGDFYHLKNQIWDQIILLAEKISQTL